MSDRVCETSTTILFWILIIDTDNRIPFQLFAGLSLSQISDLVHSVLCLNHVFEEGIKWPKQSFGTTNIQECTATGARI